MKTMWMAVVGVALVATPVWAQGQYDAELALDTAADRRLDCTSDWNYGVAQLATASTYRASVVARYEGVKAAIMTADPTAAAQVESYLEAANYALTLSSLASQACYASRNNGDVALDAAWFWYGQALYSNCIGYCNDAVDCYDDVSELADDVLNRAVEGSDQVSYAEFIIQMYE